MPKLTTDMGRHGEMEISGRGSPGQRCGEQLQALGCCLAFVVDLQRSSGQGSARCRARAHGNNASEGVGVVAVGGSEMRAAI